MYRFHFHEIIFILIFSTLYMKSYDINNSDYNTVLCTPNTQDNRKSTHKSFRRRLSASPVKTSWWCCLGRCARDGDDEAPAPRPICLHSMSHTGGKLYLPPSLLRLMLRALMYKASYTPLSNHLGSVVNTSVFSNSTECWGWSSWMCLETSEVVKLGRRCSLNLAFRDLSVSPTYTASYSSHLILYTGLTTFSLFTGSFGFTNNCRSVFVGLKYPRLAQRPRQHHQDVLTDEADSRRRKLLWVDFLLSWVLGVQRTVLFQNQDRWVYVVK